MHKSFVIVEDFYPDPAEVRQLALSGKFYDTDRYVGLDSDKKVFHPEIDNVVSHLVGEPVSGLVADDNNHGGFRVTLKGMKNEDYMAGIHVDSNTCYWAGIVYLTLPDDLPQGRLGTTFYRHKKYNIVRLPLNEAEEEAWGVTHDEMRKLVDIDGRDYSKWEYINEMPFAYNRLVLFRPWHFHDSGLNFGDKPENGRLIQTLFFQRGQQSQAAN